MDARDGVDEALARLSDIFRLRDGLIAETEVYFGWDLPHPAKPGGFVET